jgi:hypothetical protein
MRFSNKLAKIRRITIYIGVIIAVIGLSSVGLLVSYSWRHHQPAHLLPPTSKATTVAYQPNQVPAGGTTLVPTTTGSSTASTKVFAAPANWDIYWSFECNNTAESGTFSITVFNAAGHRESDNLKPVASHGASGYGDQPYHTQGTYYLVVQPSSGCQWQLTAKSP